MIVVDTSALMAILLDEPERDQCLLALAKADRVLMSAGSMAEALVAGEFKGVGERMASLLASSVSEIVPVTEDSARNAWSAFRAYGKGRHPAKLNYGDCFSYAAARHFDCPLLFIGNDFSQTDIQRAI